MNSKHLIQVLEMDGRLKIFLSCQVVEILESDKGGVVFKWRPLGRKTFDRFLIYESDVVEQPFGKLAYYRLERIKLQRRLKRQVKRQGPLPELVHRIKCIEDFVIDGNGNGWYYVRS